MNINHSSKGSTKGSSKSSRNISSNSSSNSSSNRSSNCSNNGSSNDSINRARFCVQVGLQCWGMWVVGVLMGCEGYIEVESGMLGLRENQSGMGPGRGIESAYN